MRTERRSSGCAGEILISAVAVGHTVYDPGESGDIVGRQSARVGEGLFILAYQHRKEFDGIGFDDEFRVFGFELFRDDSRVSELIVFLLRIRWRMS